MNSCRMAMTKGMMAKNLNMTDSGLLNLQKYRMSILSMTDIEIITNNAMHIFTAIVFLVSSKSFPVAMD